MAEAIHKSRLSLTKAQAQTAAGAELLALCQTVTEDGSLSEGEIAGLRSWLEENRSVGFPSIEHLSRIIEGVISDGKVTDEGRKSIYEAIESVLPPEARREAAERRRTAEADLRNEIRAEREGEKRRQRDERERQKPVASFSRVWVAGVRYENRAEIVRSHVSLDDQVFLIRDRENKFSKNAIEVRTRQGYQIGFLPEEEAVEVAPFLDQGCLHFAEVEWLMTGGKVPIPVIRGKLYSPDSGVVTGVSEAEVPAKRSLGGTTGCLSLLVLFVSLCVALAVLLVIAIP
jgi:hypothetical protein